MSRTHNHSLQFKYSYIPTLHRTVYKVQVGGTLIGFVDQVAGGHEAYSPSGHLIAYKAGVRRYAAEELAREAGLLQLELQCKSEMRRLR